LKAEEGDAVAVGAVVLIDTEGAKPEGSDKSEGSTAEALMAPVAEAPKGCTSSDSSSSYSGCDMLQGHLQLQEKF
jgi:pyruvate/2-oxoglutarate dehydrogenase complex dihydrolipoamide acyltransferase (E2) component